MSDFIAAKFFKDLCKTDNFFYTLTEVIKQGENQLYHKQFAESMAIDSSWIKTIDSYLYSIENIVKKPKQFIKESGIVVPVEKAKRIDAQTVRHLAVNSNLIRSIDERGNVIPIKVLTKEYNEDFAIYENKVVFTLINRLVSFIEQKYQAISELVDAYDTSALEIDSNFNVAQSKVLFKMSLEIKNKANTSLVIEQNHRLLEQINEIRKRLAIIKASAFYRALSGVKPILPPIMKTNIFKMDVDYKNAYALWLFISSFVSVGYSVQLDEKTLPIDGDYYDDLTSLVAISLKTVLENMGIRDDEYKKITFKARPKKKFTLKKVSKREIDFDTNNLIDSGELVNQHYFEKIKELLALAEKKRISDSTIIETKTKRTNFRTYFRELNNLNNAIYKESLNLIEIDEDSVKEKDASIKNKQLSVKRQTELYKRYKALSRLKLNDLDKTLKEESQQLVKLEKLKRELSLLKEKKSGRKPRKVNPKSLENLKHNKKDLIENAAIRQMQMLTEMRGKTQQQPKNKNETD